MAQSVTWEQALEILKELKEKYSLSYCGPATPEEAEQVVAKTMVISCSNITVMNILNKI